MKEGADILSLLSAFHPPSRWMWWAFPERLLYPGHTETILGTGTRDIMANECELWRRAEPAAWNAAGSAPCHSTRTGTGPMWRSVRSLRKDDTQICEVKYCYGTSGHATPKHMPLVYGLFWVIGTWKATYAEWGFLWTLLICLKINPPKGSRLS